jgi:hypothetical protein
MYAIDFGTDIPDQSTHLSSICREYNDDKSAKFKPHRFMINFPTPETLRGSVMRFTGPHGIHRSVFSSGIII